MANGDIMSVKKAREVFAAATEIVQYLDGKYRVTIASGTVVVGYAAGRAIAPELVFVGKTRNEAGESVGDRYLYVGGCRD